jgi:RecQ family ATP-dependent DNA helicase
VAEIRELIAGQPEGITRSDLLALARAELKNPQMTIGQLDSELEWLGDQVTEVDGRLRLKVLTIPTEAPRVDGGYRRLAAVDLETVLRYTELHPEGERTIFQVGAVRFGSDAGWIDENRVFDRFVGLPDDLLERIVNPELRARIQDNGKPANAVLADLLEFIDDADALVAYNGRAFDFDLLDNALKAAFGHPLPRHIKQIDGLYLALAVWPVPPRDHALSRLINREQFDQIKRDLEIDLTGLVAHNAADDCEMLIDLMRFAAAEVETWPDDKQALVRSVGARSHAWQMLFALLPAQAPGIRAFDVTEVRSTIADSLDATEKPPVRPTGGPIAGEVDVTKLLSSGGGVDVDLVVSAVRKEAARVRQEQRDMVEAMRSWIAAGINALVEAPTGTGKTFAILANALDWLNEDRRNRVVISTFTKQLQRQLADAIYALSESGLAPGLIGTTSLIKGASNRLSLAGLVRALSDCTDPPKAPRRRIDFVGDPLFAELSIYLALRFVAKGTPVEEWEAHSVDPVDIEPFFETYLAGGPGKWSRRAKFLGYLSQAESTDYRPGEEAPAQHTSLVREVLGAHRLLITNHALLLRHIDDFTDADRTMVIIDEAHSLEAAATNALEAHIDYGLMEEVTAELHDWIRPHDQRAPQEVQSRHAALAQSSRRLEDFLDNETVPRLAGRALDTVGRDLLHPDSLRVVTLASPVARPAPPRDGFVKAITELANRVVATHGALEAAPHREDRIEDERRRALIDRFDVLSKNLVRIIADLGEIIDPADPAADPPNRVVWLDEQPRRNPSARGLRFGVTSSPIELSREPTYAAVARAFARVYYVSATLRVDGKFDFIRRRLAISNEDVQEKYLPSPFDIEAQAKLVCFTDFPSWTEQESAAVRSVAQQVAGFLAEAAHGDRNGAMVLTTSRSAANQIYDRLISDRSRYGGEYAVSSAGYLGTGTAVEEFKRRGGALVGTKGLWQGVDIDVPERLRLVWINKLPFASFADPVISARREVIRAEAEDRGEIDPDGYSVEHYYLPLAAMELRQAVGRLIRSDRHRGVVVISDRKLAGPTRLHHRYRQVFLGSLDGMVRDDATWGVGGGNLRSMAQGWREIWQFMSADPSILSPERAAQLSSPQEIERLTLLPSVRAIRDAGLSFEQLGELREQGPEAVFEELITRAETVGRQLAGDRFESLYPYQEEALEALAEDRDVLAILPTSRGKSFIYQLPAFVLPGVTLVVSPLVALMTDQALGLNRSVGDMVRALVAPMRESNSRTGKAEVADALTNPESRHGIKIVYISPERLCQRQFQAWIEEGVKLGLVTRIAIDEAHTFATWGEDFRPSFRRAERFLARLRQMPNRPRILALTATATPAVRSRLRRMIFGLDRPDGSALREVTRNPIRPELALYRKSLGPGEGGPVGKQRLLEALLESSSGHTIVYTLTVKEARAIHAALLEHFGESERDRIKLFHGRMTSSEKEAVGHDFSNAPKAGEEGFRPMIVVATGAFGLGVDRPDVRSVIVASPPADLSGLYQQIGRAGRDGNPATGIMIGSGRAFRTLAFMEQLRKQLDPIRVARVVEPITTGEGPVDVEAIAEQLLDADRVAGVISEEDAEKEETIGQYTTAVVRVLAALDAADLIEDHGDFPDVVKILHRDDAPPPGGWADLLTAISDAIADPNEVDLVALAASLGERFSDDISDPGDLWLRLLELHSLGYLDVSQQPTRRHLTTVVRKPGSLPADFARQFISDLAREERERLVTFLTKQEVPTCVNDDFRAYFQEKELPANTCSTDENRCSGCWWAGQGAFDAVRPVLLEVLTDRRPRPARAGADARGVQSRVAKNIERLLRGRSGGLSEFIMAKTLRGEDHYWSKRAGKMQALWPELVNTAVFGAIPSLRPEDMTAALGALVKADKIRLLDDGFGTYRLTERIVAQEIREARLAQAGTQLGLGLEGTA